jgi:nucleotide-binding universal stress UspA family protein
MRVLFPTDGSEQTEAAFENFLRLMAAAKELDITVLCVQHKGFDGVESGSVGETFEKDERDEVFPSPESADRAIARCSAIADRHERRVRPKILKGNHRKLILEEAQDHDLLVMHELSRSNLKDALSGSATEHLARRAPCAVLLVPSKPR